MFSPSSITVLASFPVEIVPEISLLTMTLCVAKIPNPLTLLAVTAPIEVTYPASLVNLLMGIPEDRLEAGMFVKPAPLPVNDVALIVP